MQNFLVKFCFERISAHCDLCSIWWMNSYFVEASRHQEDNLRPNPTMKGAGRTWKHVRILGVKSFLNKHSCLFVCSRVRTRREPWNSLSFLCLMIVTVHAEFPEVISSLCAIEKHFRSLEWKTMEWWFVRKWAPFQAIVLSKLPLNHHKSSPNKTKHSYFHAPRFPLDI